MPKKLDNGLYEMVVAKAHYSGGYHRQPGDVVHVHKHARTANLSSGRAVDPEDASSVKAIRKASRDFRLTEHEPETRIREQTATDPKAEARETATTGPTEVKDPEGSKESDDLDDVSWPKLWALASEIAKARDEDVEEVMGGRDTEKLREYVRRHG